MVAQVLAGDASQFRQVVDAWQRTLLRMAYRFTGNWADAEEITQTTLIRVYRSLSSFKPGNPFEPWLFRIHLNNCRSYCTRRKWERLLRVPLTDLIETPAAKAAHDSGIDRQITQAVEMLPWRQRSVFSLIELEEFSINEAAELLGCAEATVRVHLHRAKQTLKKRLKGLFDE